MSSPLLSVEHLNITFQSHFAPVHAVNDLNFVLHQGESLALVGESGCGKSTTALALMQLLSKKAQISGNIRFDGQNLLGLSSGKMQQLRGKSLSMIFQEPMTSLNPVYTIGDQIIEVIRLHQSCSKQVARQRAIELLDLVKIPEPHRRVDAYPHQLSGGQRQRAMIAMAVSCQPKLLIADEPTTALDVTVQAQILNLLDQLRQEFSMSLLLITHDLGVVSQWTDHVAVMYGGVKVEEGQTQTVLTHPQHPYTQGLLATSLHGTQVKYYTEGALPEIHVTSDKVTGLQQFDVIQHQFQPDKPETQNTHDVLLDVQHLSCEYHVNKQVIQAVNDVSFSIKKGQVLGLVGESGCGKSTLSKTLLRLLRPKQGQIYLQGTDIAQLPEKLLKPHRSEIQMVFQDPYASLNPRHTVFDILDTILKVHGMSGKQDRKQQIATMLDRVGLPANSGYRYPHEFSGGQRQRIGIARALILKPSLVICDEPVSALDVSIQAQILNLLIDLKKAFNLSYLFISHDLAVVRYISDQVMVMQQGQIVEQNSAKQIWHQPQHAYTKTLIESIPV